MSRHEKRPAYLAMVQEAARQAGFTDEQILTTNSAYFERLAEEALDYNEERLAGALRKYFNGSRIPTVKVWCRYLANAHKHHSRESASLEIGPHLLPDDFEPDVETVAFGLAYCGLEPSAIRRQFDRWRVARQGQQRINWQNDFCAWMVGGWNARPPEDLHFRPRIINEVIRDARDRLPLSQWTEDHFAVMKRQRPDIWPETE